MSQTRALFASIGVSVSLVAAAALSLLAVSAVFAFGGLSDPVVQPISSAAIVLVSPDGTSPQGDAKQPAVVLAPSTRGERRRSVSRPARTAPRPSRAAGQVASLPDVTAGPGVTSVSPPVSDPAKEAAAPPKVVEQRRSIGNGLRTAGEDLSTTVENAGSQLAQVTQPLAPPVSSAVQTVMNIVATLLRRAIGGVGDAVDRLLPQK